VFSTQKSTSGDALKWASATGKTAYGYVDGSGIGLFTGASVTGTGFYANDTSSYFATYIAGSEYMRLTDTGLGIGTSSPTAKLNVVGTGDMSGIFESTGTSNAASAIIRSGNGTTSGLYAYARFVNNDTNAQDWRIGTYGTNNLSIVNAKAGTTPVVLDTSGNLGLGVTPSAWNSAYKAFQNVAGSFVGIGTTEQVLTNNAYVAASGNYTYINTAVASKYSLYGGGHLFFTAPSGTAGAAITFTQAMTLDASGNLLVGTTSTSGSVSNVQTVAGGIFKTVSGSTSVANATATTLATLLNQGQAVYMVTAGIAAAGSPTLYSTVAIVSTQGTATNTTTIQTGTNIVLSMSGLNLQVTQTAGTTYSIAWTILRIA
jgi:hypothetical protein